MLSKLCQDITEKYRSVMIIDESVFISIDCFVCLLLD